MSLVEKIQQLASVNNVKFSTLEKDLGFSRGLIYKRDKNIPSVDKVIKVANYFKVSIDSLLGNSFTITPTNEAEQIIKVISNPDNIPYILVSAEAKEKGLSPETLKQLIDICSAQNKKG
jgi:hypothetical protein